MTTTTPTNVDFDAIKTKQQATWSAGDFAVIGTALQLVGEAVAENIDISAGETVLDVAAGNGNVTLAAARRGGLVTATDYVPELLAGAQARADAEGLKIVTKTADAEALPFDDNAFDVVVSTYGVMFAPNQERAGSELVRVTKPGGRIGLANWTPDGFIGQMFKVTGRYVPPPAGIRSPLEWGTETRLQELLAGTKVTTTKKQFVFRYRSAQEWLDTFRAYYGPTLKAFAALDESQQIALEKDLLALAQAHNTSTTGGLRVPADYLEVIAVKAG